jgi:hypothetical protein
VTRARLNIFLEPEHAKRLEDLAVQKAVSKSSIVAAALSNFLAADGGEQRETVMGKRLDRLSHQFDRLERDQYVLIETLALYVRYYLTVSLPVPEGQQEAARAQGRARFTQFIEQLARHLQRGRSLVREVQSDAFAQEGAQTSPAPTSEFTP